MTQGLELELAPGDAGVLARLIGGRRGRATKLALLWHDTAEGALAGRDLVLAERREGRGVVWQMAPAWAPPGVAAPLLAEAATPEGLLGRDMPGGLMPLAGFAGTRRGMQAAGVDVLLLEGEVRSVTEAVPVCRARLTGPAEAVTGLALDLAGRMKLGVAGAGLAAAAFAAARRPLPAVSSAMPVLTADLSVGGACALACGRLSAAILRRGRMILVDDDPDHVHQMRVALRRLRSALAVFGHALPGPEMAAARDGLKALGDVLAPARDWDVFTGETARAVVAAFAEDEAVGRVMAAAERRRLACRAALRAYLEGTAYRQLGVRLAALVAMPPWERAEDEPVADPGADEAPDAGLEEGADEVPNEAPDATEAPLALTAFAAKSLSRALRKVLAPGADIDELPETDLHAIRLRAKRLRYVAEMFVPLFPHRHADRFLRRLGALQEVLGHLNDGAVAAGLLAQLGGAAGHGFGAGAVRGFIAARSPDVRAAVARRWRRLRKAEPFWE